MTLKSLWRLPLIFSLVFSPLHVWAGKGEVVYDVSGKHGENDQNGTDRSGKAGRRGDGSGADGADGGDAVENPNKNGQDAGSLFLNLSFQDGSIAVQGNRTNPGARSSVGIDDKHKLTADLKYDARAVGGRGGRGGNGGAGQDGGDGEDGRRASHIGHTPIPGGNGMNGGRGGDEGDSTSGGHAGRGGNIEIQVGIRDTDLAMLVSNADVSGNRGGERGRSQGAGRGGKGGDGGASDTISWSEKVGTEDIYEDEDEYNNENEKVGTRRVFKGTRDIMETKYSTAPGGFDGSDGQSGRSSTKATQDGRDSEAGSYSYVDVGPLIGPSDTSVKILQS